MVAKKKKEGQVKVGKLKLNKGTVKDLTTKETKRVKGGLGLERPRGSLAARDPGLSRER